MLVQQKSIRILTLLVVVFIHIAGADWIETKGPSGGTVSALVVNSGNIFAVANGRILLSTSNGTSWKSADSAIQNYRVNCLAAIGNILFAGTSTGGVFSSANNGINWASSNSGLPLNAEIGALAASSGGHNYLIAGTLGSGVFGSIDSGKNWNRDNTGLPQGTRITALYGMSSATFLAATNSGGVYTYSGGFWSSLGLTSQSAYSFALKNDTIIAGTSNGVFLHTTGTNWTAVNTGLPAGKSVFSLFVSDSRIFAGVDGGGVFVSINSGVSWEAANNGLTNTNMSVRALVMNGTNLFTGLLGGGVFLSTNNGTNWNPVDSGLPYYEVNALAMHGDTVFAGTGNGGDVHGGVFRTTDNGSHWTACASGLPYCAIQALIVSGTNIFAGTNDKGVYISTNQGTSWTAANNGIPGAARVQSLAVKDNYIFVGTGGSGVFRSADNGSSWAAVNAGLTNTDIMVITANDSNIFAGTSGGVFLSFNNGTSWAAVNNGLSDKIVSSIVINGANIFAGTMPGSGFDTGGVYISTNKGASWRAIRNGIECHVYALAVNGNNTFAGTADGIFLTANNGASWTAVRSGFSNAFLPIKSLIVCGSNIFAATWSNGVWRRPLADFPVVPVFPPNWAVGVGTNPSFNWTPLSGAISYSLQVSIDSTNFISPIINQSGLGTNVYSAIGLANNTKYFWRVNVVTASGTSAWSDIWNFTTVPPVAPIPVLTSPSNNSTNSSLNPTLTWNASTGAITYRIQVAVNSGFSTTITDDSNIATTFKSLTSLTSNTTYYWRANAANSGGTSAWSSTWSFTTIPPLASAITLISPSNLAVITGDSIDFVWQKGSVLISKYWIDVANDSAFANIVSRDTEVLDTTKKVGSLANDSYWWRVKGYNGAGWGDYSLKRKFIVNKPLPGAPTLFSPANNAIDISITPILKWNAVNGSTGYRIQVARDSVFASIRQDSILSDTSVTVGPLVTDTVNFWRVIASNANGLGTWSATRKLTTIVSLPLVVTLRTLASGDTVKIDSALIAWTKGTPKIDKYRIEYAADSAFTSPVVDSAVVDTFKMIRGLTSGSVKWWRVQAHNAAGWGSVSAKGHFNVKLQSTHARTSILPKTFRCDASGQTGIIRYDLPQQCDVALSVYDIRGRLIQTFAFRQQESGSYAVKANRTNMSVGQYFIHLEAGEHKQIVPFFVH